jgi:hypothetical protein
MPGTWPSQFAQGDRVSYIVAYDTKPDTRYVTEYGRVTSIREGGYGLAAMARIAVENPQPGRSKYVTRKIRDIKPAPGPVTPAGEILVQP